MEQKIKEIIEPIIRKEGYILKNFYFTQEIDRKLLVVLIDSEKGINANDCAKISKLIDPILEQENVYEDNCFLIVSSPGEESSELFFS